MTQNDTFTVLEQRQWHMWKQGKESGLNDTEIGETIHRKLSTVARLKKKAKRIGEYQKWVLDFLSFAHEEYRELFYRVKKTNPELALQDIGKKVERGLTITHKVESTTEIKETKEFTLNINELPEDERNLVEHAVRVYLTGRSKTKPSSVR